MPRLSKSLKEDSAEYCSKYFVAGGDKDKELLWWNTEHFKNQVLILSLSNLGS